MTGACAWERKEMHAKCQYANLKERDHSEDLGVDIKMDLKEI
jgi:hypothetical protein